ncbi:MAG: DNA replication/repair protein RecF [Clostridiaceae bacterium]|nr:DNA replication/repair protein RecF [Clostridiaceae bacterium]
MYLSSLRLTDFRNHADTEIHPDPGTNLILGANAQGKTNLLEAIVCLSRAQSFRARRDTELRRFGTSGAALDATLSGGEREYELRLLFGERKQAFVNGVRQRKTADFTSLFHVVLFCPEDLELVRGAGTIRRRFIDNALCALRPNYEKLYSEYNRLHAHIVRLLRDGDPDELLDDFSYRLYSVGARMIPYRAAFCESLSHRAAQYHAEIADSEVLMAAYKTVSTVTDTAAPASVIAGQLWAHYLAHKDASRRTGCVLTGPHRDDLLFCIGGCPAKEFASQGQARTAAIACKLAEREIFRKNDGDAPILLLDDVLSELDEKRRLFILQGITGGQVFITSCEAGKTRDVGTPEIPARKIFYVENGRVTERK